MDEFIGKDEAFVEHWPVRQGLEKLADVFKGNGKTNNSISTAKFPRLQRYEFLISKNPGENG